LVALTYPSSLFHVVGRSLLVLGTSQNKTEVERMCDPNVKESFSHSYIPQSSRGDIQPCIVSSVDFFS